MEMIKVLSKEDKGVILFGYMSCKITRLCVQRHRIFILPFKVKFLSCHEDI